MAGETAATATTTIETNRRSTMLPVVLTSIPLSSFGTGSRLGQSLGVSIKIDLAGSFQRLIGIRNDGVRLVLLGIRDDFE